jgi:aldose 1-epimerase
MSVRGARAGAGAERRLVGSVVVVALALWACGGSESEGDEMTEQAEVEMAGSVSEAPWGEHEGRPVSLFVLENRSGMRAAITSFGANLVELWVPDRDGRLADVVLGFDSLGEYEVNGPSLGSTVGRVANRIALGRFELDGEPYELATNNGRHHLHGGLRGFNKVLWEPSAEVGPEGPALTLRYVSPDGEEGYPGRVDAEVVYTLTHSNELRVEMSATSDAPTPVNLAHHSYWNLAGHDSGDVLGHTIELGASAYTPTDEELIPTGEITPVVGTPFDLTSPRIVGEALDELAASREREPSGYDVNFVVDGARGTLRPVARVGDPASGRILELESNEAGVQLYTGNFLAAQPGKAGAVYEKHQGLCLETQLFPDAINKLGVEGWDSPVLRPGEQYRHVMVHRFSTD